MVGVWFVYKDCLGFRERSLADRLYGDARGTGFVG